ncbi:MAG: NmrA/HSCARG family protein [Gemmatimonadetes bacterium]|nr:NmrA/HSCARG family protein [Gemmatimonadota bacterium]
MRKGIDAILVTGATGNQGGALAHELLAGGHKVLAMTRKPEGERARELAKDGAAVVQGDLDDAESLKRALEGMWGVFAVQNTWEAGVEGEEEQGKRLAQLSKEAGVRHYVYSSVASAQRRTGIPHFDNKWRVEETVRGLGFPTHVIIRAVFFMENWLSPWFKPGIDDGKLMMGIKPETVLQMIAVRDLGKYLLLAVEKHEELNGREIDIASDALTMPEAARIMSEVVKRPVIHVQMPIEEVRKFSADFAAMLEWFDRVGYEVDIASNAKAYGVRPTTFREWAAGARW